MNTRILSNRTTFLRQWFSNILISGSLALFNIEDLYLLEWRLTNFKNIFFSYNKKSLRINGIAYEKIAVLSKTNSNLMERVALFYIFVNLLNVWFNRISPGFSSASVFVLLQRAISIEIWEGNLASHKCIVGKVRRILNVFLYNFEYCLILHQKSAALLWGENENEIGKWK